MNKGFLKSCSITKGDNKGGRPDDDSTSLADQTSGSQNIGASTNLADQVGLKKGTIPYFNMELNEPEVSNGNVGDKSDTVKVDLEQPSVTLESNVACDDSTQRHVEQLVTNVHKNFD